jgi:hypothetical protein
VGTKHRLRSPAGEDLGTFETNLQDWWPGMEVRGHGNRRYRIEAINDDEWKVAPVEPRQVLKGV